MKKRLSLALALVFALGLAACSQPEPAPPEETVPAPEIATPQEIENAPTAVFLDWSGLTSETLDQLYQPLNLSAQSNGVTVTVTEVVGDGYALRIAGTILFPETVTPAQVEDAMTTTQFLLDQAGWTLTDTGSSVGMVDDHTLSFLRDFRSDHCVTGEPLCLTVSDASLGFSVDTSWTADTFGGLWETALTDDSGQPCGSVSLSPLSLSIRLDAYEGDADAFHGMSGSFRLLDDQGQTIECLPSFTSHLNELSFFTYFYRPVELNTVAALELGPYQADFPGEVSQ